jgi:hypothetical protein
VETIIETSTGFPLLSIDSSATRSLGLYDTIWFAVKDGLRGRNTIPFAASGLPDFQLSTDT